MSAKTVSAKTETPILGPNPGSGLGFFLPVLAAIETLARVRRNRAAIQQLADADDHMLRDIGVTRSEVNAAYHAGPLTDPGRIVRVFSELK